MKKVLSILLTFMFLTGCMAQHQPIPTESTAPTVADTTPVLPEVTPTDAAPVYTQQPMVAISMPHSIETVDANNGSLIFRSTTQSMQLTMRDPDVADKIIIDFLNRVDSHSPSIEATRDAAQAAYNENTDWNTYFYDLIYDPTRIDQSVLSLYGEAISYASGNHPQRVCLAANYNMVTGDVLTLGSILYHIDSKAALAELVVESLDAIAQEKYLLDGYDDVARRRFNRDESFDEDWYFTNEGLCFYFSPYEIAPYSSGVVTAMIPYAKLTGIIDNAFFPPETDLTDGSIEAIPVENADMSQFSQIAELTIDQDGQMYFLYTTGYVCNVRIETTTENGDHTIFATKALTPGDAIMVKVTVSEEMPELKISYEIGGKQQDIALNKLFSAN